MIEIYVHIPFCNSKCVYCAFASFVCTKQMQEKYFDFLIDEISSSTYCGCKVSSIYFGGGTPSCVDEKFIKMTIEKIKEKFDVAKSAEITIECNPCSVDFEKLAFYKKLGFNRISFGVQSLNNKNLKFLGRRHTKKVALQAIKLAQKAGFENISADLILGLKNRSIVSDAKILLSKNVKHISAYMLQIEDGTPLKKLVESGKVKLPDEDKTVDNYQKLAIFLQKKGLKRYEISNFALPGFECKHNKGYWNGTAYVGFGLGAHSFDGKRTRVANATNFDDYFLGKREKEVLTKTERDEEIVMLGLRCDQGVDIKKLSYDIQKNKHFDELIKQNILIKKQNKIFLNPKYYGVSNFVITNLIENA